MPIMESRDCSIDLRLRYMLSNEADQATDEVDDTKRLFISFSPMRRIIVS